jgi:hypothetical protein
MATILRNYALLKRQYEGLGEILGVLEETEDELRDANNLHGRFNCDLAHSCFDRATDGFRAVEKCVHVLQTVPPGRKVRATKPIKPSYRQVELPFQQTRWPV